MVHTYLLYLKSTLFLRTHVRHLSAFIDNKPTPVAVSESKETKTGDKLTKQMENLLKLPTTHETVTLSAGRQMEKPQALET